MDRNIRLLAAGFGIRSVGAALYNPFLALFLYSVMRVGYLEIGVIFVGVGAIQLPFGLAGGLWTDRVGRRKLIVLGLATEAVLTAALAYAFDIRSLGLAIAVAAVGGSILAATGAAYSAYVADWSTGSERTRAFTWYRISYNAGFAVGVSLGGILVEYIGFTGALLVAALLIGSATAFVSVVIGPSPFDVKLRARKASPGDLSTPREGGASVRQSLSILSRDRIALLVATGFAFAWLTSNQWNVTFSLFAHNKLGIAYSLLGIGFALNGAIVVIGQSFTTETLIGHRHTTIAILGTVLYVAGFLLLGVAALWMLLPGVLFLVAVTVVTVGENCQAIPGTTLPSNLAPAGEVGAYNGAFNTFMSAASLAAIFFGGAVLSAIPNPLWEWIVLTLPAIPAVILLRFSARRIPPELDRA